MNDFPRAEKLQVGEQTGVKQAYNELEIARELVMHVEASHSSTTSPHVVEALDHIITAVAALSLEVDAMTGKVWGEEQQ